MRLEAHLRIINQLVNIGGHQKPEQFLVNTEGIKRICYANPKIKRQKSKFKTTSRKLKVSLYNFDF
jgi:hypothetical protein